MPTISLRFPGARIALRVPPDAGLLLETPGAVEHLAAAIGPRGPAGPQGLPGNVLRFDVTLAGTWTVPHGLGRAPLVQVFLASGEQVFPDVSVDAANVVAVFAQPTAGFVLVS